MRRDSQKTSLFCRHAVTFVLCTTSMACVVAKVQDAEASGGSTDDAATAGDALLPDLTGSDAASADAASADAANADAASADAASADAASADAASADAASADRILTDSSSTDHSIPIDVGPGDAAGQDAGTFSSALGIEIVQSDSAGTGGLFPYVYALTYWPWALEVTDSPVLSVGDCGYYEPEMIPQCDPPCELGHVCNYVDLVCLPHREPASAGAIDIEGLNVGCTLQAEPPQLYYSYTFTPEPTGPLFDANAAITVRAAGAELPAFELSTQGVPMMQSQLPCALELSPDTDFQVTWTAWPQGDTAEFVMESGNHAAQFPYIKCVTADNGSLVVDAALINRFLSSSRPIERWRLKRERHNSTIVQSTKYWVTARSAIGCMSY